VPGITRGSAFTPCATGRGGGSIRIESASLLGDDHPAHAPSSYKHDDQSNDPVVSLAAALWQLATLGVSVSSSHDVLLCDAKTADRTTGTESQPAITGVGAGRMTDMPKLLADEGGGITVAAGARSDVAVRSLQRVGAEERIALAMVAATAQHLLLDSHRVASAEKRVVHTGTGIVGEIESFHLNFAWFAITARALFHIAPRALSLGKAGITRSQPSRVEFIRTYAAAICFLD